MFNRYIGMNKRDFIYMKFSAVADLCTNNFTKNLYIIALFLYMLFSSVYLKAQITSNVSLNQNFILETTPRIAEFNPSLTGYTTNDIMQTIQYLDGLGRPLQTTQIGASPSGFDIVQPIAYDQFGREPIKYLPYALTGTVVVDGSYKSTALTDQLSFYTTPPTGVSSITTPQAGTAFEPSPLNRVL
jgi:Domain of unknown function (DUF6443)